MEPTTPIAGAAVAITGRAAASMLRQLAAQPGCSSDGMLILADSLDEAAPLTDATERPKIETIIRLLREMAPLWAGEDPAPAADLAPCECCGQPITEEAEGHFDDATLCRACEEAEKSAQDQEGFGQGSHDDA